MTERIRYSVCWEDQEAINGVISPGDNVLMVASAGDLALGALQADPASIVAVDSNQDQLMMMRYKELILKERVYEEAMQLLGLIKPELSQSPKLRPTTIADSASGELKAWIQANRSGLNKGVYLTGQFERYLHSFVRYALPWVVSGSIVHQFLSSPSLEVQRRVYHNSIDRPAYRFLFKRFFGRWYMKRKGRHPDLLKHVKSNPAHVFYDRMKHAWTEVPIKDNHFFRLILEGKYDPRLPLPLWLQRDSVEKFPALSSRLTYEHRVIAEQLMYTTEESFDVIYLSDITDILSREGAQEFFQLCRSRLRQGGRLVLWNNLVERRPHGGWHFEEALSRSFWRNRKVSFYGWYGVYSKNGTP